MKITTYFLFICFVLAFANKPAAQQVIPPSAPNDTTRVILIKQARSLREKQIDSATTIKTAAGEVIITEGKTTTNCDSAAYNQRTNILEAFGNIHINDNDSIHTYAQYLRYIGLERIAYLKKNVRLTDKKGTLYTEDLEYNLRTGIATYKNGGRIVNGSTLLTSKEGVYYADTKDVYFKNNVHLKDPKYNITTDSLRYNIKTGIANFITYTKIINKDGSIIETRSGTYDLNTGNAVFFDRTAYKDSNYFLIADKMAYEEKTGILQMEGNAKLVDSANQVTVLGGLVFADKKKNTFLATNKSVMILYKENDSTYITADTLYSGLRKYDSLERKLTTQQDTLNKVTTLNTQSKDTSIRYFIAFHHVRIFNDSLQAVSDSLHYSTSDSTFKLFGTPIVWNNDTQVTGDTIHMYTQNQKPKRLYVFNNGIIINEANKVMYNQVAGRTLNGYFKDGQIDYVRVKGSPAESIFYPQDNDSAYIGMNRSSGDVIDIYFVKKELNKVKFVNNVDGVMYPLRQIPADKKELKNFKWWDYRRPKNKLELFE
ncbi:MAG: LPS export ABC transporter periplasmic protein LptC [Chitinophagaceae bacterium]|nr:LPS export ABC transporter periplasmic protein LptC [Chitinophagaceae bacterium]